MIRIATILAAAALTLAMIPAEAAAKPKQPLRDWMNSRIDQATGQTSTPGRNGPADVLLGKQPQKPVYGPANDQGIAAFRAQQKKSRP